MIVQVGIGDEEPRRYQVRRQGDRVVIRAMDDASGDGAGSTAADVEVDWRRPQPGIYSLLIEDRSFEVFIDEEPDHLAVHLVKRSFQVRAKDIRRHRRASNDVVSPDGAVRITAPIPGRVARILVQPGDRIAKGDGIVVVEAMKMENELRAPRDGVVSGIEVEEGQGVEGGALLATIE